MSSSDGIHELTKELQSAELRLEITNVHIQNLESREPKSGAIESLLDILHDEAVGLRMRVDEIKTAIYNLEYRPGTQ